MLKRIPLAQIAANADQPRKIFEAKALEDLAASLKENGLKQPITVRPMGKAQYEIVMGERRFRAHQLLAKRGVEGFDTILCHVRAMDDMTRDIDAIIENLQRADIKPIEEARAFQRMVDRGYEPEALAKKLGMQTWRVEERTRLLKLEPALLQLYETGNLSQEAASEISRLPDHTAQMKVARLVQRGVLSGYKAIRTAVDTVLEAKTQTDIFGDSAPKASEEDVRTVNRMEEKIETMARMAAAGWKDGECVVATKVSPDRARLMADKLKAMQSALYAMERELRMTSAQAEVVLAA